MLLTIGVALLCYVTFIRPFTTETKINDDRTDNFYLWMLSFFLILLGAFFNI